MNLRKMAEDLLALQAYKALVETEYQRRHDEVEAAYLEAGIRGQDITLPDGTRLGGISLNKGKTSVSINNHDAMLEWLEQYHPTEIVTKTTHDINPAYWRVLVMCAEEAGIGVDPDSGMVLTFVTVREAEPSVRVTSSSDAKRIARELASDGVFLGLTAE